MFRGICSQFLVELPAAGFYDPVKTPVRTKPVKVPAHSPGVVRGGPEGFQRQPGHHGSAVGPAMGPAPRIDPPSTFLAAHGDVGLTS